MVLLGTKDAAIWKVVVSQTDQATAATTTVVIIHDSANQAFDGTIVIVLALLFSTTLSTVLVVRVSENVVFFVYNASRLGVLPQMHNGLYYHGNTPLFFLGGLVYFGNLNKRVLTGEFESVTASCFLFPLVLY
jgi:hypothetical protein